MQIKNVEEVKAIRVEADALIQKIKANGAHDTGPEFDYDLYAMAQYQALRAATEAKMWLGKMLEGMGNPFPAELADKAK
jgi:hypothetical protein